MDDKLVSTQNIITPKVSIVMATYNEPVEWLREAINSIISQSFEDFEFIIIVDNPDNTAIINELGLYKKIDSRLIILVNTKNIGLARSLNRGIKYSQAKYIARMDADDISLESRLQEQVDFLENNRDISLVGTAIYTIDTRGRMLNTRCIPNVAFKLFFLKYRTLAFHPTWLIRRECYIENNYYRNLSRAQDVDFLNRMLKNKYKLANINTPLLKYREKTSSGISNMDFYSKRKNREGIFKGVDVNLGEPTNKETKAFYFLKKSMNFKKTNKKMAFYYAIRSILLSKYTRNKYFGMIVSKLSNLIFSCG